MARWNYTRYDGGGAYWTAWLTPDWPLTVVQRNGKWVGYAGDGGPRDLVTKPAATRAEAQRRTAQLAVRKLERLAAKARKMAR